MMKNNIFCLIILASAVFVVKGEKPMDLREHEIWWTAHRELFGNWLLDIDSPSRVKARSHVKKMGYINLLDIPCGHCVEYLGFKKEKTNIDYCAIDITQHLVDEAFGRGLNAIRGSIESIPLADSSFDVCYARHILEHLDYYEKAVSELIRVAKKEVIIVFFINLGDNDKIDHAIHEGNFLYHNSYGKNKLIEYVLSNKKVENIDIEEVMFCASSINVRNETNYILHIYLK